MYLSNSAEEQRQRARVSIRRWFRQNMGFVWRISNQIVNLILY